MPLEIRIYSSFIVINTFLETKGILNSIRPGWMDFSPPWCKCDSHKYIRVRPTAVPEGRKFLRYNTAWHKYTENNQSFFGLIQCCLIRYLPLCAIGGLGLASPKAGFLFGRHWKFLEAFIQVSVFSGLLLTEFLKTFVLTLFIFFPSVILKYFIPRHQDLLSLS